MLENEVLSTALKYAERGFSVIPVRPDKRPFIAWQKYQKRHATAHEITRWFERWPQAMIGIVTGKISGLAVVDIDSPEGAKEIGKYIPLDAIGPTAMTPRGGLHHYFKCPEGLGNNTGAIPGCDLRANGGYVVAPPSSNGEGKCYQWMKGLSIFDVPLPELPEAYLCKISDVDIVDKSGHFVDIMLPHVDKGDKFELSFSQGKRDDSLFHTALALAKGGCSYNNIIYILNILASHCSPPFPATEVPARVKSAFMRLSRRQRNLAEEVHEWVMSTNGNFMSTDIHKCLQLSTRDEIKNLSVILSRLCKEGVIERVGSKNGSFRRVEAECERIDFLNAPTQCLQIRWPFEIEKLVETMPGNVAVIAGEPNSGKTAYLLNLVQMNMERYEVHYFSCEMGAGEFKKRLANFHDCPLDAWKFHPWERNDNFADVIRGDALNIVDYLEIHENFYLVGQMIKGIHDRLRKGIAIIALQKNRGTDLGLGGMRGLEKPRLYLAMSNGTMKIIKAKNWAGTENPNAMELKFRLLRGAQFIIDKNWHRGDGL